MEPLSAERVAALQGYLAGSLKSCEEGMKQARESAGYRAISAPRDTTALAEFARMYGINNEIRAYINVLLNNFPELRIQYTP